MQVRIHASKCILHRKRLHTLPCREIFQTRALKKTNATSALLEPINDDRTECLDCEQGKYSKSGQYVWVAECSWCPAGYYNDVIRASGCKACPEGKFGFGGLAGVSHCQDCPAGYETSSSATSSYYPYIDGGDNNNQWEGTCKACTAGKYSTGGSECQDCPGNQVSAEGSSTCMKSVHQVSSLIPREVCAKIALKGSIRTSMDKHPAKTAMRVNTKTEQELGVLGVPRRQVFYRCRSNFKYNLQRLHCRQV